MSKSLSHMHTEPAFTAEGMASDLIGAGVVPMVKGWQALAELWATTFGLDR